MRCRYLRRNDEQCTAEAVDPVGEVLLCTKHLGRAMEMLKAAAARQVPVGKPTQVSRGTTVTSRIRHA